MTSKAMIVVGGGSSTRFGADKLLAHAGGLPLVAHTVTALRSAVDRCILVCRPDQEAVIASLELGVDLAEGGSTRTDSEIAGLEALEDDYELVGIHDAARPNVGRALIDRLFAVALEHGGAIPVLSPPGVIVDRETLAPIAGVGAAQTPQVFRSAPLRAAYRAAAREGFEGHDTAEVVQRFTATRIVALPGDPDNFKVTYPEDLARLESRLGNDARIEPR